MDKISVFGATGFIGSHFCEMYPDEVIKIPREQRFPESNEILYLISTTDNYNVFGDMTLDVKTNLLVLMEVLQLMRDQSDYLDFCFNFVSSWFVYGTRTTTNKWAQEFDHCLPNGFYSITKRCAEQLLISFCQTFGIKYRIFRLANVYGIGDKNVSNKKNIFLHFIKDIKNNKDIRSYWGGKSYRNYIHVKDACRAIHLCMEKAQYNEIINIGATSRSYQFRWLMEYAIKKTNSTSKIIEIPPTPFHQTVQVRDFFMDTSKLKSYGFVPEITIEQGIDEYIESLK